MKESTSMCPMAKINSASDYIIQYISKKLKIKYGNERPRRGFHAKSIGRVKATLTVDSKLPERLEKGLFKTEKKYDALIRFTNGDGSFTKDSGKRVRGMAIKIMDTQPNNFPNYDKEEGIQDIILFTSPISVPGKLSLQTLIPPTVLGNGLEKLLAGGIGLISSPLAVLNFFTKGRIETPNILEEMFWSATPYCFGKENAIKWHTRPLKTITTVMPDNPSDNFLTAQLISDLKAPMKEEISFGLFVHFQENEKTEPIEDPSVEWKTSFHRVATINIPPQMPFTCEKTDDISFSPGLAIPEHAPLGGVNMIRKKVYETLAKARIEHP